MRYRNWYNHLGRMSPLHETSQDSDANDHEVVCTCHSQRTMPGSNRYAALLDRLSGTPSDQVTCDELLGYVVELFPEMPPAERIEFCRSFLEVSSETSATRPKLQPDQPEEPGSDHYVQLAQDRAAQYEKELDRAVRHSPLMSNRKRNGEQ